MIRCGPQLPFSQARWARRAMVCIVFPRPISSARMPFSLRSSIATSQSSPMCWYSRSLCRSRKGTFVFTCWRNRKREKRVDRRSATYKLKGIQLHVYTCKEHSAALHVTVCTAELKLTAGHWPFFVQFSTMATQNLILFVSNCIDGQSKFPFGQPNPKPYFQLCICVYAQCT